MLTAPGCQFLQPTRFQATACKLGRVEDPAKPSRLFDKIRSYIKSHPDLKLAYLRLTADLQGSPAISSNAAPMG